MITLLCKIWRFVATPAASIALGTLVSGGIIAGILFWGGFHWAMEMTNTEEFCISCHEMQNTVYVEYKGSIHDTNRSGVRATCPDCHVPKEWQHKIVRKIQASNEIYHKVLGSIDTQEKFEAKRIQLAANVWRAMKKTDSRECRNCHNFDAMDLAVQESRARDQHSKALDEGKTCIECHQGIAHELPAGAFEEAKKVFATIDAGH